MTLTLTVDSAPLVCPICGAEQIKTVFLYTNGVADYYATCIQCEWRADIIPVQVPTPPATS